MSYTISLKNPNMKTELKKKLNEDISYSYEVFKTTSVDDDHDSVINHWISTYAGDDRGKKAELEDLKKRKVGNASGFIQGVVKNGMKIKIFALSFTAKDSNGDRTYNTTSASIELTSGSDAGRRLIRNHFQDLAILAITGGENKYTLPIEG